MPLKIYNTLTKQKDEFQPLDPPNVKMYVCGITPYDETHLGHARAYVTFDVIRRYLEELGYRVEYVQNITDVDDKLIKKSQESGETVESIAAHFTDSYKSVMKKLNILDPTQYVKATDHIQEMVKWVKRLIDKGFAYEIEGDVYYSVEKFREYGKLSKRKIEDMVSGARVAVDERKKNPLDFALWKTAKEGEPAWGSPWGKGRPGWHIECSVMSTKYLGEQFDIHGGGLDLVFPHHENEIAQTEAVTGRSPWVKYWVHNGFVNVNKQKMSKSLGNFFTLKDIFKQFEPMAVRLFILQTHYRGPIDFSDQELEKSNTAYGNLCNFVDNVNSILEIGSKDIPRVRAHFDDEVKGKLENFEKRFRKEMDDDFNTAAALAVVFKVISFFYSSLKEKQIDLVDVKKIKEMVSGFSAILGINVRETKLDDESKRLVLDLDRARSNKDFATADQTRLALEKMGYKVKNTKAGTVLTRAAAWLPKL
ncbi:cysteine--tRNA ligase [candidate division WOR-1 bacterium RIFCSPLOWO2_02_FULL_46_20]|uniref:Cysteine--tRNA ligase n=2 Tax=Saganbacteria TaxID=1703751 RepID=A0A1F4R919_UNCSA|nr:MAG: cysteine--tRNA ligase [candidate division WOR-1 bacterium RIFCSPHIGHO2_02_FULL_45_12]OGC04616.1 MAG: cysteine--tRNA ligase [candidate division WOR-1 bacterium RIFCSPLOWO2_02_FULL_46_20]OGC08865.1 MAG: cysteine--tRNA ligase [candidate division WOR-1 bacterium RIFCSPLOWO2_12_FULL_45_9]